MKDRRLGGQLGETARQDPEQEIVRQSLLGRRLLRGRLRLDGGLWSENDRQHTPGTSHAADANLLRDDSFLSDNLLHSGLEKVGPGQDGERSGQASSTSGPWQRRPNDNVVSIARGETCGNAHLGLGSSSFGLGGSLQHVFASAGCHEAAARRRWLALTLAGAA